MPIVVYQGFSIHGNEASGANAGLLAAYYLAAAQGDRFGEITKEIPKTLLKINDTTILSNQVDIFNQMGITAEPVRKYGQIRGINTDGTCVLADTCGFVDRIHTAACAGLPPYLAIIWHVNI